MRKNGSPTSSKDTKAIINLETGDNFYHRQQLVLSGSETASSGVSQVYDLTAQSNFTSSYKAMTGSVNVRFNGQSLVSNAGQLSSASPADFYLSGSHNEWVIIKSPASKLSPGREMKSTDNLLITFQKTVKN